MTEQREPLYASRPTLGSGIEPGAGVHEVNVTDQYVSVAERDRYREALREAVAAARLFNQRGLSWHEYDAMLARWEALDG